MRILRVQRMLGVDEGADAAELLHLGNDLQGQRGLARRFGTINLHHPPARQAADAERDVQAQRAGGHDLDVLHHLALAQAHDRTLAELFFDLRQRCRQRLGFFCIHHGFALFHLSSPVCLEMGRNLSQLYIKKGYPLSSSDAWMLDKYPVHAFYGRHPNIQAFRTTSR
ncbi:hypothetical protein THIARS_40079 [Thiomonas delicata]|uniref:Uncharacterized protein n=1 Tax=Thiomonas delicata TaxID=364030 RepID=A0A238CZN1_THIDL|nr:hypothetical protein THIARS_40079 [Thiomonas delicata]